MEMPDLTCLVRLPGEYPIAKLQIQYQGRTKTAAHFLSRDLPPIQHEPLEDKASISPENQSTSSPKGEEVRMLPKEYEQYPEIEDAFM
jgi:type IV secretory pathway TraG/TraD family ATPase VirD4